jgi:hypothetical protein
MENTIESLAAELKVVKGELSNMTKRTGCPSGFLPVYKLAIKHDVSERVVKHIVDLNPRMAKRTYSTKYGGHIVNCRAYSSTSFKKAFLKFIENSKHKGKLHLENNGFKYFDPEMRG